MENQNINETNGANNTSSNNNNSNLDVELERILDRELSKKANGIIKSHYANQGLSEDDLKEAISNFKNSRKAEEEKRNKEFEDLNNNYLSIQKELKQERLNNALTLALIDQNLSKEQVPLILKLIEVEGIMNDKYEINEEKMKENINNLFKAFPELAPKKETNNSNIRIGSDKGNENDESTDAMLRKAFGLK